jgi:hypothetical protein
VPCYYDATSLVALETVATGWVSAPALEPVALRPATGMLIDNARVVFRVRTLVASPCFLTRDKECYHHR